MNSVVCSFLGVMAIGAVGVGCIASEGQLRARAGYDLDCPHESLHITEIDLRTRGVSGCGQKATYVENCEKGDCTWILNGVPSSAQADEE